MFPLWEEICFTIFEDILVSSINSTVTHERLGSVDSTVFPSEISSPLSKNPG